MKKFFVLILLMVVSVLSHATVDNPCNIVSPPGIKYAYADFADGAKFACAPFPIGTGTLPSTTYNAAGIHSWWYCKTGSEWHVNWVAGTNEKIKSLDLAGGLKQIVEATDPVAKMTELMMANSTNKLSDAALTPVWCPNQNAMVVATPLPDMVPTGYVVDKNGTSTTRASFALVAGKRTLSTTTTVDVGAVCNPNVTMREFTKTYMLVAPGLVAVCVKKP